MGAISEDEVAVAAAPEAIPIPNVEQMPPEAVLRTLAIATSQANSELAAACCKRVRVLCRDVSLRRECLQFGALRILKSCYEAMPNDESLVLHSLAALVNVYADETFPRSAAVEAGAVAMIAKVIADFSSSTEVTEMACLATRNLCYGVGADALRRRKRAAADGAVEAVIAVLNNQPELREVSIATLRICVDGVPELKQRALKGGAPSEGVKPLSKDSGGSLLSFRGGLGTNRGGLFSFRSSKSAAKVRQQDQYDA